MTATYRTGGKLTNPVNDLDAARQYLRSDDMTEYVGYAGDGMDLLVHHIEWDLLNDQEWEVRVTTTRRLTQEESTSLSEWISGQNSDGLGEGFEQQAFADCWPRDRWGNIDEDVEDPEDGGWMASFDWQENRCLLDFVK